MLSFGHDTISFHLSEAIDEGIIVTNVYVTHMCLIKQKYFPNPEILELSQIKKSMKKIYHGWVDFWFLSFFLLLDFWSALRLVF